MKLLRTGPANNMLTWYVSTCKWYLCCRKTRQSSFHCALRLVLPSGPWGYGTDRQFQSQWGHYQTREQEKAAHPFLECSLCWWLAMCRWVVGFLYSGVSAGLFCWGLTSVCLVTSFSASPEGQVSLTFTKVGTENMEGAAVWVISQVAKGWAYWQTAWARGLLGGLEPTAGPQTEPSAAALQPSGSTRTVGPAKFKAGSSKSAAAQDPGRGAPGAGPETTVPHCRGHSCHSGEIGTPETTFLYLDDNARGHVSQHHAVAGFVGCLAPWPMAFHELLFKLMLVQGEQRGAVLLAGCLHQSGHRSWGQEQQLLAEPESPGHRAHSGQWGGKTEQTRGAHGKALSGPGSDREESPSASSALKVRWILLQVLRSPLMHQFNRSAPIWQAGDLGNPCRQATQPHTHSPRPCTVYSVLSTAVHALPAGKYFLVNRPKISSKHPEVPFSQEGEAASVKLKSTGL